jgi:hypothetical protein
MRVSVDRSDPAYCAAAMGTTVYLDGERCPRAVSADEERGEVVILDRDNAGLPVHRTRHGKVTLELSDTLKRQLQR